MTCIEPDAGAMLMAHLNCGKAIAEDEAARREPLADADLIVREGPGSHAPTQLRQINASTTIVTISPYGDTGPQANDPATDLTLFFASGISRLPRHRPLPLPIACRSLK